MKTILLCAILIAGSFSFAEDSDEGDGSGSGPGPDLGDGGDDEGGDEGGDSGSGPGPDLGDGGDGSGSGSVIDGGDNGGGSDISQPRLAGVASFVQDVRMFTHEEQDEEMNLKCFVKYPYSYAASMNEIIHGDFGIPTTSPSIGRLIGACPGCESEWKLQDKTLRLCLFPDEDIVEAENWESCITSDSWGGGVNFCIFDCRDNPYWVSQEGVGCSEYGPEGDPNTACQCGHKGERNEEIWRHTVAKDACCESCSRCDTTKKITITNGSGARLKVYFGYIPLILMFIIELIGC